MNPYIIMLIVAVVVIGFVSIGLDRRWQARKAKAGEQPKEESNTSSISSFGNIKDRVLGGKAQRELAQKFQAWADQTLTTKEKDLKSWIAALSLEDAKTFTGQVAAFCAEKNMDLAWLVDEKLDKDVELEKAAKSVVISYCLACCQADMAQADFKVFTTYQSMLDKPSNKTNQALSQNLFTELIKQDMAPAISPELFAASEKEKQAKIMESIEQAAATNQVKFNNVFKQVLEGSEKKESSPKQPFSAKLFKSNKKPKNGQGSDTSEEGQPVAAAT